MRQIAKKVREEAKAAPAKKKGTTTGSIMSTVAGALAGAIPLFGKLVSPIAAELGQKGGDMLQNFITGHGDYEVTQNTLLDANSLPLEVRNDPAKWTVLRKREYLGNVYSAPEEGAFAVTDYSFNIGLPECAPWGYRTGQSFREWIASGAIVEFESTTSPIAPSGGSNLGSVMGAVEYNSSRIHPFTNEDEMENQDHSVSRATSQSWIMPIECAKDETVMADGLWTRSGPLPAGQPAQLYDHCVFSIGTIGQANSSTNLGKLYLTYEVYVRKPTINIQGSAIPGDLFITGNPDYLDPLGTDAGLIPCPENTLNGSFSTETLGQYLFNSEAPPGDYEVRIYQPEITCATTSSFNVGIDTSGNIQLITSYEGKDGVPLMPSPYASGECMTATSFNTSVGSDGQAAIYCFRLRLLSRQEGSYFTIVINGTDFAGAGFGSVLITAVDPNLLFSQPVAPPLTKYHSQVCHLADSGPHCRNALERAETRESVRVAVVQFKDYLSHKKRRCRNEDLQKYLPKTIADKLVSFNFGEEKQVDIDSLISLARTIIEKSAPTPSPTPTQITTPTESKIDALKSLLKDIADE